MSEPAARSSLRLQRTKVLQQYPRAIIPMCSQPHLRQRFYQARPPPPSAIYGVSHSSSADTSAGGSPCHHQTHRSTSPPLRVMFFRPLCLLIADCTGALVGLPWAIAPSDAGKAAARACSGCASPAGTLTSQCSGRCVVNVPVVR